MNKLLILLLSILLIGCEEKEQKVRAEINTEDYKGFYIVKFQNCEYLRDFYGSSFLHKANCTNTEHKTVNIFILDLGTETLEFENSITNRVL